MARNTISRSIPVVNSIIIGTVVPITIGIISTDEGALIALAVALVLVVVIVVDLDITITQRTNQNRISNNKLPDDKIPDKDVMLMLKLYTNDAGIVEE